MFRSSTILRKLVQSLAKIIFQLKHSVKLRREYYVEMWQRAATSPRNIHDVILLSVLIEI